MNDDNAIALSTVKAEVVAFDYETISFGHRSVIESYTKAIKERIRRATQDIIEIGEMLTDVKSRLPHGQFTLWLQIEFSWDIRSAQNFMSVAKMFKNEKFSFLTEDNLDKLAIATSALYLLARPSTSEQVRNTVIKRAVAGEIMTHTKVKQIVAENKDRLQEDFAIGDWVEVRRPGTWHGKQGPVTRIETYEITVQIDNGKWKFLRFYREELVKILPFEQNTTTSRSFYKPDDLLIINCPKRVRAKDCDYKKYNGCWAVVNRVGESKHLEVQLAGGKVFVMTSEVDPIDDPPRELKQVAHKVNSLLSLNNLAEIDRHTLNFYLRKQIFDELEIQRLDQIWNDYLEDFK